ncbi:hypothetical protein BD309DRAFT_990168 [Dichomitus squalens]|nr:hypothetical protein BD309DRAFT_990168 [Dichomitus squalens]
MANDANVFGLQDVGDREAANAVPRSSSSSAEASTRAAPAWTRDGVLQLDTAVKWTGGRKKTVSSMECAQASYGPWDLTTGLAHQHRVAGRRGRPPKDPRKGEGL